jgi:hypothetical protein
MSRWRARDSVSARAVLTREESSVASLRSLATSAAASRSAAAARASAASASAVSALTDSRATSASARGLDRVHIYFA